MNKNNNQKYHFLREQNHQNISEHIILNLVVLLQIISISH